MTLSVACEMLSGLASSYQTAMLPRIHPRQSELIERLVVALRQLFCRLILLLVPCIQSFSRSITLQVYPIRWSFNRVTTSLLLLSLPLVYPRTFLELHHLQKLNIRAPLFPPTLMYRMRILVG